MDPKVSLSSNPSRLSSSTIFLAVVSVFYLLWEYYLVWCLASPLWILLQRCPFPSSGFRRLELNCMVTIAVAGWASIQLTSTGACTSRSISGVLLEPEPILRKSYETNLPSVVPTAICCPPGKRYSM